MEPIALGGDFDLEQRDEFRMIQKSYEPGDRIFEVVHSNSEEKILYVRQNYDYVDNSKIVYNAKTNRKVMKLRRDQGLPAMPMYLHDYRTKKDYKWKGYDIYVADKVSPGHHATIIPAVDHQSFEIVDKDSKKTMAFVQVVDKTERGVCNYKISCDPNADISFITTIIVSADDKYMGMVKIKDSAVKAMLCNIV